MKPQLNITHRKFDDIFVLNNQNFYYYSAEFTQGNLVLNKTDRHNNNVSFSINEYFSFTYELLYYIRHLSVT